MMQSPATRQQVAVSLKFQLLGSILLNYAIYSLGDRTKCTQHFVGSTSLREMANMLRAAIQRAAIQRD